MLHRQNDKQTDQSQRRAVHGMVVLGCVLLLLVFLPLIISRYSGADHNSVYAAEAEPASAPLSESANQPVATDAITISINDALIQEGDNPDIPTPITFTVTLTGVIPLGSSVEVTYETRDGPTGEAGVAYQAETGTVTFVPGETSKDIVIDTIGNREYARGEVRVFYVDLTSATLVNPPASAPTLTITKDRGEGSIRDNDNPPVITIPINEWRVIEGNGEPSEVFIEVELSNASRFPIFIDYRLAPCTITGCATLGEDFELPQGRLAIPAGSTGESLTILIYNDDIPEGDEIFLIDLFRVQNPEDSVLESGITTITIVETPRDLPNINFDPVTYRVLEGQRTVELQATLTYTYTEEVTAQYFTTAGSATAVEGEEDYDAVDPSPTRQIVFPPGERTASIEVSIIDDNIREPIEDFFVSFSNSAGARLGENVRATIEIVDDDGPPTLAVNSVEQVEGENGATTAAAFTVSLAPPSLSPVSIDYTIVGGTATEGEDFAFPAGSGSTGSLTFQPGGDLSQDVVVNILGDGLDETNETVLITLSNPQNAEILPGEGEGILTIQDDDGPTMRLNAPTYTTNEGAGTARIDVVLSAASPQEIEVDYRTVDLAIGNANFPEVTSEFAATGTFDYEPTRSGSLIFPPDTTRQSFEVTILDDELREEPEILGLELARPVNATLGNVFTATLTIEDDEGLPEVNFISTTFTISEGMSSALITMTARIEDPPPPERPDLNISVLVSTRELTGTSAATAGEDYQPVSQTVAFEPVTITETDNFVPVVLTETLTVQVLDDDRSERSETFQVELSDPDDARLGTRQSATVTILDNDEPLSLSFLPYIQGDLPGIEFNASNYSIAESGGTAVISVTINAPPKQDVILSYEALPIQGSATPGIDYITATGVLQFNAGITTTQTFTVTILDDNEEEGSELIVLILEDFRGPAKPGLQPIASLFIQDDDRPQGARLSSEAPPMWSIGGWFVLSAMLLWVLSMVAGRGNTRQQ